MVSRIPSHIVVGCLIFNTHASLCWTIQLLFRKTQFWKRNHVRKTYGKCIKKPFRNGPRLVTSSQDSIISNCIMVVQTMLLVPARLQTPQGSNQLDLSLHRCQEISYIQQTVSLGQKPDRTLSTTAAPSIVSFGMVTIFCLQCSFTSVDTLSQGRTCRIQSTRPVFSDTDFHKGAQRQG